MDYETELLARTLYAEAADDGLKGIEAVASVIMNRVRYARRNPPFWWGDTVTAVCLKPGQFQKTDTLPDDAVGDICRRVATRAVKGLLPDIVKGATRYHALDKNPGWASALVPCAQIGNNLFYACF